MINMSLAPDSVLWTAKPNSDALSVSFYDHVRSVWLAGGCDSLETVWSATKSTQHRTPGSDAWSPYWRKSPLVAYDTVRQRLAADALDLARCGRVW